MAADVTYNPKAPVFDKLGMGFQNRHFLQIGPFTNQWRSSKSKIVAALFETNISLIPIEMHICERYIKKMYLRKQGGVVRVSSTVIRAVNILCVKLFERLKVTESVRGE